MTGYFRGFAWSQSFLRASLVAQLVKNQPAMQEDPGSIPGSRRSPGEGIGYPLIFLGFLRGSEGKESVCNAGDLGLISGLGRSPGKGNSYPLQYSCLENSKDRGAWQAIVHGVAKSRT